MTTRNRASLSGETLVSTGRRDVNEVLSVRGRIPEIVLEEDSDADGVGSDTDSNTFSELMDSFARDTSAMLRTVAMRSAIRDTAVCEAAESVRDWSLTQTSAWFGRSMHLLDVQMVAVVSGVRGRRLEEWIGRRITRSAVATASAHCFPQNRNLSVRESSDLFWANYCGIRGVYLRTQFRTHGVTVALAWTPPLLVRQFNGVMFA